MLHVWLTLSLQRLNAGALDSTGMKNMSVDDYMSAKAWPFEQARALLKRLDIEKKRGIDRGDRPVTFETGYGPSGLPHIGTFGEVVRTTMVRNAFVALTDGKIPTKLICVSDDMDGMRKIPPTEFEAASFPRWVWI